MFTEFIVLPVHVSHNLVAFITDALVHYWVINVSIWLLLEYGYFKVKGRLIFFSFFFFSGSVCCSFCFCLLLYNIWYMFINLFYLISSIRSIVCLNLPSFSGGLNPWGTPSRRQKRHVNIIMLMLNYLFIGFF